ncbi:MmgE/PrpD family protein [Cupriavidus necator]|uniref:MmgE/PrpD family protein n=1 Tax=Cupriavidus necator TaxID=106590 RepID=UPI00339D45D3
MNTATATLSRFVNGLQFERLPEAVVAQARMSLLNYLACAVAGADEAVVVRSRDALKPFGAAGAASLVGRHDTTDPITAAFLNCLSSTVLAFDETHARSIVHPVGPVAASTLALAEVRHLSGKALVAALAAGVEVASRTSLAISAEPAQGVVGWSQSGVCGGIGAAAAVGKLLGLDACGISDAIALGANASAGLRAMNGTMAVTVAVSNAAANGYRAALLASAGVSGPHDVLEHPYGFLALFAHEGHVAHLTEGLGFTYAISELNFKPYPCGIVAHAAIDAGKEIRSQPGFKPDDIERVMVGLHPSCLSLGDRPVVSSDSEASVSIQFWAATALLRETLGPECLNQAWIADAARQQLQQRVRLEGIDNLSRCAARMTVALRSGVELHADIANCLGSERNPMKLEEIEAKFVAAASGRLDSSRIEQIIKACRSFEAIEDVAQFLQLLRTHDGKDVV